ncbi:MAG TPA: MFS transporter [Bryobacteraceae bacterium]|nr:MFS transporter [Bryobacteraceae bacterium]
MTRRSGVLSFLAALAVITFLDRLCISVAGPRMQEDLHISTVGWGWILGAFVLSYGIFEIPTGALGDRRGHGRVLTRIVLWWSVFTSLTGASTSFAQLLVTRFLFGVGEAGAYPNLSGVIKRWFAQSEAARAQGVIWSASRLGGALAPLTAVPLIQTIGWRATFFVFGGIGIVWVLAWRRYYNDRYPASAHPANVPWSVILRSRQVWLIFAMYGCYAWGSWFFMAWFPTYLVRGAGFSEAEMGIFSSGPFLLGVAGNLVGGFASDRLVKRLGLRTGRRLVACSSLAVSAALILGMALTRSKPLIVVLASFGFGVMDLMLPTAWAVCMDIGQSYAGIVTGVMNSAGQLGGFLCTVAVGYIVRAEGYSAALFVIAAMLGVSIVLFSRIDPEKPILAAATGSDAAFSSA